MHQLDRSDHGLHDALLIASHAAGDLTDSDRTRADALIAACAACAELRRDLVAIAATTRSAPAPTTLPRDFRLTADQAQRLRRQPRETSAMTSALTAPARHLQRSHPSGLRPRSQAAGGATSRMARRR